MGSIVVAPPPEVLAARAGRALAELLICDFEGIALERYVHDGPPECPCQRGVQAAQRIARTCRNLVEELERYERCERICQTIEGDPDEE